MSGPLGRDDASWGQTGMVDLYLQAGRSCLRSIAACVSVSLIVTDLNWTLSISITNSMNATVCSPWVLILGTQDLHVQSGEHVERDSMRLARWHDSGCVRLWLFFWGDGMPLGEDIGTFERRHLWHMPLILSLFVTPCAVT
jgi:hypothetical protein